MVGPERRGQHTGVTMFKIFLVAHQRTALYTHVYTYVTFRGSLRNALKTTPFYLSTRQKKSFNLFPFSLLIPLSFFHFIFHVILREEMLIRGARVISHVHIQF